METTMRTTRHLLIGILLACVTGVAASASAKLEKREINGKLPSARMAATTTLSANLVSGTIPDYEWWYGCSPTAAGMLMAYYDINGYGGMTYQNLLPGAVAEASTFPSTEGQWDYAVQDIIASQRHVGDFYAGGYLASGDDLPAAPTGPLNSLADFMGTSQDAFGNVNGGTGFWFYVNGNRLTVAEIFATGDSNLIGSSGAYGIYEFLRWAGYADADPGAVSYIYNQYLDSLNLSYGFTFSQYRAEIDAGRVILIHLENHTMLGHGYDAGTGEVIFHDTANPGGSRMPWGGTYYGYRMIGVTVVDFSKIEGEAIEPPAPPSDNAALIPVINLLLAD
jgi:hypothetical protein